MKYSKRFVLVALVAFMSGALVYFVNSSELPELLDQHKSSDERRSDLDKLNDSFRVQIQALNEKIENLSSLDKRMNEQEERLQSLSSLDKRMNEYEERLLDAENNISILKSSSDIRIGRELNENNKTEELEMMVQGMKEFYEIE